MRATNEMLSNSEIRYNYLIGSIPEVIGELDLDGTISFVSPQVYDLLGYHPDEIIGTNFITFIHPDDVPSIKKIMKKEVKLKEVSLPNLRLKHKKGNYILVFAKGKLIKVNDKARIIGFIRDITKFNETEKKLKESEEKFRLLFESIADPIHVVDADLKIIYANPAFERWLKSLGLDSNIIGKTPVEAFPFIGEKVYNEYQNVFKTKQIFIKEDWAYVNDKHIFTESRKIPILKSGNVIQVITIIRDFSDRKNVELKLKDSQKRYKNLYKSIPVPSYTWQKEDNDLRLIDYNDAAEEITHGKIREFLGVKASEFHVEDPELLNDLYTCLKEKKPFSKEIVYSNKSLDLQKVFLVSYAYTAPDLILVHTEDITERKDAEQKLRESEERYRRLVEDAQEGVWALDENENTIFVNPRICEMLAYTKNEMMGKNLHLFIPNSMEERINGNRIRREKGIKETYDLELVKKDGTIIYTKIKAAPIMSENRDYQGSFAYITDITTQKHAEDTLRESEELFRTIFETAKDCIFIKDRSLQYIRINKAMEEIFGVSSEDLLNKTDIEIFGLEAGKHVMEIDQRVIQGEIIEEEPTKPINGIPHTFHTIKVPLKDTQGDIYGLCGFARDISDRKIFEQKLIESEEKFRTISEQSSMGIIILQNDKYKYVNQAAVDMFGYTVEELLDAPQGSFMDNIHPEDREFIREQSTKKQMGMEDIITNYPYRGLTKSGETIWLQNYSCTITFEGKSADLITMIDLTERKKAEEKLLESEEKYRTLSDYSMVGISIIQDWQLKYINQKLADDLGYTIEELLNIKPNELFAKIVHPDDLEYAMKTLKINQEGRDSKIIEHVELRCLKKSGDSIWLEIFVRSIQFGGRPAGMNVSINITERRKIQKKLKESEKKYRALFENTPIGVTLSDYEGHVIEINEQMKKLLGYELEEFQKLGVAAAYANDQDRNPFENQLEEQGHIKDYEIDLKKKDGKVFPALLNSIKTNITGGPIYINTIRDITEKKEIEEIKTHLLTRFSHEFKTPLISINGFSDLLLSEYKNKLDEKMIGFLEKIRNGGERLKLLVNAFIQSSQLGEKITSLNIDKENLSDLIKLGVSEMQSLIHLRKHTINMDFPEELIGEFDKEKIYLVITNLLMNAIKYTPLEGKIFIHSKIEEENIFFSIKDSGIGLTEEDKRHLFKLFGKIEKYGKGWDIVSEGMGIGLYLSKEIISLHGGKIWTESEGKNKGSTFYFSLPMTNN